MIDSSQTAARAWALLFQLLEAERPKMLRLAEEFEMSPVELMVMRSLRADDVCSMQSLPASKFHDKSTMTRVVDRLVKRGLIDRAENPTDRRVKDLTLTPAGTVLREQLMAKLTTPPPSVANLSEEDRRHLVEALEKAVEAARRDNPEPG